MSSATAHIIMAPIAFPKVWKDEVELTDGAERYHARRRAHAKTHCSILLRVGSVFRPPIGRPFVGRTGAKKRRKNNVFHLLFKH